MIRLLVADDHPIIRRGLRQILEETRDITVAGEAASGDELLQKTGEEEYDVIIMDISMPGKLWLDVIREMVSARPEQRILVLSRHEEPEYASAALRAGAHGYLTKTSLVEELTNAIRRVYSGAKYISSDLAEKMALSTLSGSDSAKKLHEVLSLNEMRVFIGIVKGKSIKELAEEASLSPSTISTYRSRILQKLNLKTDADIIRYGLQHGVTD